MMIRQLLVAAVLALGACGAHAATTTATPDTLKQLLDGARDGDTIRLAPGSYPAIVVAQKSWTPPVVVEAGSARLTAITLRKVSGLTWRGGVFDGGNVERTGFKANSGERLVVEGTRMQAYVKVGIGFGEISDARLIGNEFSNMASDGIDIALSRRILIDRTQCHDFAPAEGAHPDCIQLWSRPTAPPTADITITNARITGNTQGITMFDHVRDGVPDGGFDRITVTDNFVSSMVYHGITLTNCRNCVARNNRIETMPNPNNPRTRAWLQALGASTVDMCGNVIVAYPNMPGQNTCRDPGKRRK